MVLGLRSKSKRSPSIQVEYVVHLQEIRPWPPSQSLRSIRSVVLHWENGDKSSGATGAVTPSFDAGKIVFDESFNLHVAFLRDPKINDNGAGFQKNLLEFNLHESKKDKPIRGTHLGGVAVDLAEHGVIKEAISIAVPLSCRRSFWNTAQPILYINIKPLTRDDLSVSSKEEKESESTMTSEEIAAVEEEIASFTDEESTNSSGTNLSSSVGANGGTSSSQNLHQEKESRVAENEIQDEKVENFHLNSTSVDISDKNMSFESREALISETPGVESFHSYSTTMIDEPGKTTQSSSIDDPSDLTKEMSSSTSESIDKYNSENGKIFGTRNASGELSEGKFDLLEEPTDLVDEEIQNNLTGPKHGFNNKPGDLHRKIVLPEVPSSSQKDLIRIKSASIRLRNPKFSSLEDSKNAEGEEDLSGSNAFSNARSTRGNLDKARRLHSFDKQRHSEDRVRKLEMKVEMLEAELREAAAIEMAIFSIVAEHGSSSTKVHTPARRLSRLYIYASIKWSGVRRANAAKSAVSGLILAAKSCGNDVPRLTFWLSNAVVLRAVITQELGQQESPTSLRKKSTQIQRADSLAEVFEDWENPCMFLVALERIEAWIFSRIVESIWWQTLTPHMQVTSGKLFSEIGSDPKQNYGRKPSFGDQQQANLSTEIWKRAFKESCHRLCPIRAAGHECGCLPVLARLVMEQCVARLDVAMFNAILRESEEEMPTDPISDPISDPRVLPVPPGRLSFGAGAQLKNAIGNWSRWLTDLFGMDEEDSPRGDRGLPEDNGVEIASSSSFKPFHLLNELSDLLMLPKDILADISTRKEICPVFGVPVLERILCSFVPDEFCPDEVPEEVFESLDSEDPLEETGDEGITQFPISASPVAYSPPLAHLLEARDIRRDSPTLKRNTPSVIRKCPTSDDELEEIESSLATAVATGLEKIVEAKEQGMRRAGPSAVRYQLLRQVWKESN